MKVFEIRDDWGFDHLQLGTRPDPKPGPGEVLLRMKAASLNFRDLVVPNRGYGAFTGNLPLIPLSDGVGEVIEVGPGVTRVKAGDRVCPGVTRVKAGDRVCPGFNQAWIGGPPDLERLTRTLGGPIDGTMAELMCLPAEGVVKVPAYLTDELAATLPCAALTAWSAIVTHDALGPGSKVLVQGTGGVALFALAFAKLAGCHVTVISSSDEKLARAKALGADAGINYTATPEWAKATPQSLRAIRAGGTLSMIGVLSGSTLSAPLGLVVTRQVRLQGITVGSRDGFEAMMRALDQHRVVPVIDRVYAFDELKEAMAHLKGGSHFGKICIRHG